MTNPGQSFGPKPPYEAQDTWAQALEKSTDAYNAADIQKKQDMSDLQHSVDEMYGHGPCWLAMLLGYFTLYGTLQKQQDDNNLAMLAEGSTADAGGLMSDVTELWSNGQTYQQTNGVYTGGMTQEQGTQLFMEESDLWYFLHAPSYGDTGKSMSW